MVKLYVKHNKNIALIDTDCDWQGKKRDVSLTTIGQVIAVCASEPNQGLLGLPASTPLRLYLPDNLSNNEDIHVERNEDESLFPWTCLEEISSFTNGRHQAP